MKRKSLGILILALSLAGAASASDTLKPSEALDRPAPLVTWGDKNFYRGQRVVTRKWAGIIQPKESGFPMRLSLGKGRTGVILEAKERDPSKSYVTPGEPLQVVLVEWDPQVWPEPGLFFRKTHELPAFRSTLHVEHLEPLDLESRLTQARDRIASAL